MFKKYIEINNYPLFYGALDENILENLEKTTTINLGYDSEMNIIRLDVNTSLEKLLEETYRVGSNPSVSLGKGKIQSRILSSLVKEIEFFALGKIDYSIVEIGCGEGRLLKALNKDSWSLKGFEIAPTAEVAKKLASDGIEIINDFYRHDKVDDLVDMIFSYGVLEHIIDLEEFFTESYKGLKNNGIFCHVVPDCENMLKQGNIRILSHQHVNYFTKDSLINLYEKFGFTDVNYKIITPGNALMVFGYKKEEEEEIYLKDTSVESVVVQFSNKFSASLEKLNTFLNINTNKNMVFYAGGMQEYLILKRKESVIFTNGDAELYDKKFYIDLPSITNPELLKNIQIDVIIIFASHYYDEIKNYLLNDLMISKQIKIISIDEIVS